MSVRSAAMYKRKELRRKALDYVQMLDGALTPKAFIEKYDLDTLDYLVKKGRIRLMGDHLHFIHENSPLSIKSKTQDYQNRTNS